MKTTNLILILILLVVISFMAYELNEKKPYKDTPPYSNIQYLPNLPNPPSSIPVREITLYVNTAKIHKDSTDKYANFGQPYYISNKEYTIDVFKGDIVIWKGVSITDTLDVVNIKSINHHGGPKLFNKNVLNGNGGDNEIVAGIIRKRRRGQEEKYILKFTVKRDGEPQIHPFKIDPKIRSN